MKRNNHRGVSNLTLVAGSRKHALQVLGLQLIRPLPAKDILLVHKVPVNTNCT